jgi:hypothetical protein
MATASVMLAHQVASKALRDAAFLAVWPATSLPLMMIGAAVLAIAAVPVFARLLDRWAPALVVSVGFLASALAHVAEWWFSREPWIAVVIYLHVGSLGALLLSGFWSMVGERFEPRGARVSFGRIAAAGTVGGVCGGLAAERIAVFAASADVVLLLLAGLHGLCAAGLLRLGRAPVMLPATDAASSERPFPAQAIRASPHIRTMAVMVVLTAAGGAVLDYLLKWQAAETLGTGAALLQFFAVFYGAVHLLTFAAQAGAGGAVRQLGIGRTITALPAGVGAAAASALLVPIWPLVIAARAIESVLRGSLFRSGYELLFVPMDGVERRRGKTFLDVSCDRVGEAAGAGLVQVLLAVAVASLTGGLLFAVVVLAAAALWFGRRLDQLYLGVVERQLLRHRGDSPVIVGSETGWTVLDLAPAAPAQRRRPGAPDLETHRRGDSHLAILADLRSGDRPRVEAALDRASGSDRAQVALMIDLLAWNDLVPSVRRALERVGHAHVGMLIDALLHPDTDFAIRRRVPRILGMIAGERALDGLVRGLDDARFEVRYQCGRAIDRKLAHEPALSVDPARMMAVVERELSVPLQVWQSYRLIDKPDADDLADAQEAAEVDHRNLEHVFSLLATVLPREPLQVALRGVRSPNPGLRGLALEYLEHVLPTAALARLWIIVDAPAPVRTERMAAERVLEQLRLSTETPAIGRDPDATPSSGDAPSRSGSPRKASPR